MTHTRPEPDPATPSKPNPSLLCELSRPIPLFNSGRIAISGIYDRSSVENIRRHTRRLCTIDNEYEARTGRNLIFFFFCLMISSWSAEMQLRPPLDATLADGGHHASAGPNDGNPIVEAYPQQGPNNATNHAWKAVEEPKANSSSLFVLRYRLCSHCASHAEICSFSRED